jgi:hypothetical protein
LRAAPGRRTWIAQRRDELCRYALELRLTSALGVGLASTLIECGELKRTDQKENQGEQGKRRMGRKTTLFFCHLRSCVSPPMTIETIMVPSE